MSPWSRLCRYIATLKVLADWRSMSFAGVCTTLLGLLADFVKPQFHVLPYVLAVAVVAFLVSELVRRRLRAPLGTPRSRWLARTSVSAGVATIVLAVALAADAAIGGDRGVLANVSSPVRDLQAQLLELDRTATATLEVARRIETETSRTATAVDRIDERDRLLAASLLLDRAVSAKDLSDRGQITAIETLAAAGHSFVSADLSGIRLRGVRLSNADLAGADLMMTDLGNAVVRSTNFSGANFRFAALHDADLGGARIGGARFAFASADRASFEQVQGEGANFYAASLREASFRNADLRGANLSFADLREAILDGADLTDAVLVGAMLDGASLRDAKLANTDLSGTANAGALSDAQRAGACRRAINDGGTYPVSGKLIEAIPNQRFRGGVEYSVVMGQIYNLKGLGRPDLPLCKSGLATGPQSLDFGIRFETQLLARADRRKAAVARVKGHFDAIAAVLNGSQALVPQTVPSRP